MVSFLHLEEAMNINTHRSNKIEKIMTTSLGKSLLFMALFSIILLGACSKKEDLKVNEKSKDELIIQIEERIPRLQHRYSVPGVSIALIHEGNLVWSDAYGYADLDLGKKMSVDTICRAESISKSVTAWGVMRLVEEGLIDLDAPVQKYLHDWQFPQSNYDTREITVRKLLSANAGLSLGTIGEEAEYTPNSPMPSLRQSLSNEVQLIKEPGSGFLYSNPGFNLLELVIESVTGQDFAAYMKNEILSPLGMTEASYAWSNSFSDILPVGYDLQGKPVYPYVYPVKASGGLFASVEDIARFVSAGMSGPYSIDQDVLTDTSIDLIHTSQVEIPGLFGFVADSYGFGHFIETLPDGQKAVWHGGQGHGWMTHIHLVPESGAGIVILTNSQRSWPLIAGILTDWAKWNGFESVKFSRIQQATIGLQILGVLIIFAGLLQLYVLVKSVREGRRRFAPFKGKFDPIRIFKVVFGITGVGILTWSAFQPYLFVTSIFPGTIYWVACGVLGQLLIILFSAFFLKIEK